MGWYRQAPLYLRSRLATVFVLQPTCLSLEASFLSKAVRFFDDDAYFGKHEIDAERNTVQKSSRNLFLNSHLDPTGDRTEVRELLLLISMLKLCLGFFLLFFQICILAHSRATAQLGGHRKKC